MFAYKGIEMAHRTTYWSTTKLADKLRGTKKIGSGTMQQWDEWEKAAKQKHPVRWWLAEEGLDKIQDIVNYPTDKLYDLKYYLVNRFVSKTHTLTSSSLQKGTYHEFDSRLLHCAFDELVNFVEVEKAHMMVAWDKEARKKFVTPWYARGRWKTRTWRSSAAGIAYLEWESRLKFDEDMGVSKTHPDYNKLTDQAHAAIEVMRLYTWWKTERPNRVDPYELSGLNAHYAEEKSKKQGDTWRSMFSDKQTPKQQKAWKKMHSKCEEIEQQYHDDDTEMLKRLVDVRQKLWT